MNLAGRTFLRDCRPANLFAPILLWLVFVFPGVPHAEPAGEPPVPVRQESSDGKCTYRLGLKCQSADGKQELNLNLLVQFRFTGLFAHKGQLGNVPTGLSGVNADGNLFSFGEARGRFMMSGQLIEDLKYRFYFECASGSDCHADQMWGDWQIWHDVGVDFGQMKRAITLQHSLAPTNLVFADESAYSRAAGSGLGIGIRPYWDMGRAVISAEIMNDSQFTGGPNQINNDLSRFNYTLGVDARILGDQFDWDQMDQERGGPQLFVRGWISAEPVTGKNIPSVDFGGGRIINLRGELGIDSSGTPISPSCGHGPYTYLSGLMTGVQQCSGMNFTENLWDRFYGQGIGMVQSSYGGAVLGKLGGASLLAEANYRRYEFSHSSRGFGDFMYLLEASYMVTPRFNIGFRWEQVLYSNGITQALLAGRDPSCMTATIPPEGTSAVADCPKGIPGAPGNTVFKDLSSWGIAASYLFWNHRLKFTVDYLHYQLPWRAGIQNNPVPGGTVYYKATDTSLIGLPPTGGSQVQKFTLSGDPKPEQIRAQLQLMF